MLTIGGVMDPVGHFDAILDMNVATKVLLTDGSDANGNPIEIVPRATRRRAAPHCSRRSKRPRRLRRAAPAWL